jgi:hypothetical protein
MEHTMMIAAQQLGRMRGMTGMYHRRFFFDINITTVLVLALLLIGWWSVPEAFLLVPVVALIGAVQTAFDASYLIFARTYAARLELSINSTIGDDILVAAELENVYLFPLKTAKIVTIPLDGSFTWFGFVTVFYTVIGIASFGFGLALGWDVLRSGPPALGTTYLVVMLGLAVTALIAGGWWFIGGEGERRLNSVLDDRMGPSTAS